MPELPIPRGEKNLGGRLVTGANIVYETRFKAAAMARTVPHRSRYIGRGLDDTQIVEIFNILKMVKKKINKNNKNSQNRKIDSSKRD